MQVYCFPGYVSLASAAGGSPRLFKLLKEEGVQVEERRWGGTLQSLPSKPSMVRASSMMECTDKELAQRCAELGHFVFYDDRVLMPDGAYSSERLAEEVKRFIEEHRKGDEMDPALVIRYLRSCPKDGSTATESDHALRQGRMLLKLFPEHVLVRGAAASEAFPGDYPVIQLDIPGEESKAEIPGLDVEGVKKLRAQIDADLVQVQHLPYYDPQKQALFRKLVRGLEANLVSLEAIVNAREFTCAFAMTARASVELILGAMQTRRNSWTGSAGVVSLYRAMLPFLLERLAAAGYPDDGAVVEWDYDESR